MYKETSIIQPSPEAVLTQKLHSEICHVYTWCIWKYEVRVLEEQGLLKSLRRLFLLLRRGWGCLHGTAVTNGANVRPQSTGVGLYILWLYLFCETFGCPAKKRDYDCFFKIYSHAPGCRLVEFNWWLRDVSIIRTMEAESFSEAPFNIAQTTRCKIPQELTRSMQLK